MNHAAPVSDTDSEIVRLKDELIANWQLPYEQWMTPELFLGVVRELVALQLQRRDAQMARSVRSEA